MGATSTRKRVTIQDVASASGVTKSTVSLALAGKGNFSPQTRQTIRRAARRLNYEPNPHAQRLGNGGRCLNMVALFSLALDLNVGTRKVGLLQSLLVGAGFEVPLYASAWGAQGGHQAHLMKTLCRQHPRALVCNTYALLPDTLRELRRYQEEGGLLVCYDHDAPADLECDKVIFDREDNTYQVTRHLLELGHRTVALAGAPGDPPNERVAGYRRALAEFGGAARPIWLQEEVSGPEPYSGLYEESGAYLAARFLELRPRPTAVCLLDDYAAVGFAAELERRGVRVPEDVSVVGHDDSPIARFGPLPLTTVTHPVQAIANAVFGMLQARLRDAAAPPREVVIRGELVVRRSATSPREALQ